MRKLPHVCITMLLLCFIPAASGQAYYLETSSTHCPFPDEESKNKFELGIRALQYRKTWGAAANVFFDLTKKDSTFCDAYFYAGYAMRLQEDFRSATAMYYMADSLSTRPVLKFKMNLASSANYSGLPELARDKYQEIVTHFPNSPEGYYGIAVTSIELGDLENGLENVVTAKNKYSSQFTEHGDEVHLLHGIILTLLERYQESIKVFGYVKGKLTKDDNYLAYYAKSLKNIGEANGDEKQVKKAWKLYKRIENKADLTEYITSEFQE